jgi:glycerate kinase
LSDPLRIVCCPDSLKDVLSAAAAAAALADGVRRVPGVVADEVPLADGGEGTASVLFTALGGTWHTIRAHDPLMRPISARYLRLPDGTAVVESAEAIGIGRLGRRERDPLRASSYGLGELLVAAVEAGATNVVVTLGGSATVDGGAGMREAIGGLDFAGVRLRVACDVTNPLLGERGAARAFGPQKGASPRDISELEQRLAQMVELVPYADVPGSGAAGGLGAALAALGASLEPGARLVLEATGFYRRLPGAALAVTGEGTVDATSAEGKLPSAVATACRDVGVPCIVFGGRVRGGQSALRAVGATDVVALSGERSRAGADLRELGESLARQVRQRAA